MHRRSVKAVWFFLLTLGFLTAPRPAATQETPTKKIDIETRVEALEQKLTRLEERVNAALPQGTAATTPTNATDRIAALDEKLQLLERNRKQQDEASAKTKPAAIVTAGADGFTIATPDKSYRLRVGGYVQVDGKTAYGDSGHLLTNSYSVRRARLNIDGTVGRFIDFRIAPEFGFGSTTLYDAYADVKFARPLVLRAGKFKAPLGLELLQNDTELTFIERSLVSLLVPNRDLGFQLSGNIADRLTYQVGTFNGATDGTNIDSDSNDQKELIGRVFATPFTTGPAALKGLGFGVGFSTGQQNGAVLPSLKSVGGQTTVFAYSAGIIAAGRRTRYSPQLYYYYGPLGVMAEYVESTQEIKGATLREISNHAWQVAGSWVLTGEKKSYKTVVPRKSMDGTRKSAFGAWEIAGRYTELNVDPGVFTSNLADITKSAEAARNWTLGVNWYLNRNARLSFNFENTHFQRGAVVGDRPAEKVFEQRLQVVF